VEDQAMPSSSKNTELGFAGFFRTLVSISSLSCSWIKAGIFGAAMRINESKSASGKAYFIVSKYANICKLKNELINDY
jgi:hypothetical protein